VKHVFWMLEEPSSRSRALLKDVAVDDPWYFTSQCCSLPFVHNRSSNHLTHCVNSSANWGPRTFKSMFVSGLFLSVNGGSQERSYPPVFLWISLSIHLGGVKWIIISGKDFDRPGWIKRFLRIYNYVEELLWFWNQKFFCCMIQVCLYKSPIFKECLVIVSKAIQPLSTSFLRIFLSSVEPLPTKFETSFVPSVTLMCLMFIISRYVYEHSFHELTMRYSILLKIHPSRVIPSFL
jgi:hypothetical protein